MMRVEEEDIERKHCARDRLAADKSYAIKRSQ